MYECEERTEESERRMFVVEKRLDKEGKKKKIAGVRIGRSKEKK